MSDPTPNKKEMASDGQFSRLALVSKVLMDRELLELRGENEALKHDLACKERTLRKLREAYAIFRRENTRDWITELEKFSTLLACFEQTLAGNP